MAKLFTIDPRHVSLETPSMKEGPDIARLAALIGDPARSNILSALMCGKALTAGELAREAGVTAATTSGHLSQLTDAALIRLRKQGRHRYYELADDDVAQALETLVGLAAVKGSLRTRTGPRDADLRQARVCYDHLAGTRGVQMFDTFARRAFLLIGSDEVRLSAKGAEFVREFGIDLDGLYTKKRQLCRVCLDWSERRSHLGGALGSAMFERMIELNWVVRQ